MIEKRGTEAWDAGTTDVPSHVPKKKAGTSFEVFAFFALSVFSIRCNRPLLALFAKIIWRVCGKYGIIGVS